MYWFIIIVFGLLSSFAASRVNGKFQKYSQVMNARMQTGAEVAATINRQHNLGIGIEMSPNGRLSDHYDPRNRTIYLSPEVYQDTSVAAAAVAAHEMGHAIQHAKGYSALQIRNAIFPVVSIASNLWIYFFLIGSYIATRSGMNFFITAGILMFLMVVIFQVITLPVEFDASRRALQSLEENGIIGDREKEGAKSVLRAAALTYIISALASIAQLIYYISGSRRRS
ncbi:zinc metallopeptidase [Guggenheimella bovis]